MEVLFEAASGNERKKKEHQGVTNMEARKKNGQEHSPQEDQCRWESTSQKTLGFESPPVAIERCSRGRTIGESLGLKN